jgi:hypothetical protein
VLRTREIASKESVTDWAQAYRDLMDAEMRKRMPQEDHPTLPAPSEWAAQRLARTGPLESWRMPAWDERAGYYEDGTILLAEDVPIYRPSYLAATPPLFAEASELRTIRLWVVTVARRYRLSWIEIDRLRPFARDEPLEVVWVEKFADLIRRGSEPPPVICDLTDGRIMNGSVRVHALRAIGRETARAWVAVHEGSDG